MALTSRAVTVTTSATRLDATSADESRRGSSVLPYNAGAVTVYLGGSDVTTANGVPMSASSYGPSYDLAVSDALYGIVASGTCDVRVQEVAG